MPLFKAMGTINKIAANYPTWRLHMLVDGAVGSCKPRMGQREYTCTVNRCQQ